MRDQSKAPETAPEAVDNADWRDRVRGVALANALRKRAMGVPTYTVAEAAALLSVSQEHLYRLIQAGGFPAVRMRVGASHGRYVVPAKALEQLLDTAAIESVCLDAAEWTAQWVRLGSGGAR